MSSQGVVPISTNGRISIIDEIVDLTKKLRCRDAQFRKVVLDSVFVGRAKTLLRMYINNRFAECAAFSPSGRELAAQATEEAFFEVYGKEGCSEKEGYEHLMRVLDVHWVEHRLVSLELDAIELLQEEGIPEDEDFYTFRDYLSDYLRNTVTPKMLPDKSEYRSAQRFFLIWGSKASSRQFRATDTLPRG